MGQLTLGVGELLLVAMSSAYASEINSRYDWQPNILVPFVAQFRSLSGRQDIGCYYESSIYIAFLEVLIKTFPYLTAMAFEEELGEGESFGVECSIEAELLTSDDLGLQLWLVNIPYWEVISAPFYFVAGKDFLETPQEL